MDFTILNYKKIDEDSSCPYIIIENFLHPKKCDILIDYFEKNIVTKTPLGIQAAFADRVIWYSRMESGSEAKKIMLSCRHYISMVLKEAFNESALYTDGLQLVKWPEKTPMEAHYDNMYRDRKPNKSYWRDYASVVYLNDDFKNGEFQFADSSEELLIKPKKGSLIAFKGDSLHAVKECSAGSRYTMPGWFTRDASKAGSETDFPYKTERNSICRNFD